MRHLILPVVGSLIALALVALAQVDMPPAPEPPSTDAPALAPPEPPPDDPAMTPEERAEHLDDIEDKLDALLEYLK